MNNAATLPQKMLAAAGRRQDKIAGAGIHRTMKGSGERVGRIDPVLFHQGRKQGKRLGVKGNPWDDKDFCKEMSDCHPEIGDMGGGGGGSGASDYMLKAARKLVGG